MDTRPKVPSRSYEDFQPSFEWKDDEGSETLVITLPGFKKDQLRVQMDNLGNLRVSGERPLASEHWSRFRKDFRVPRNTRTSDIRAKFENGNLYVILPKNITKSQPHHQPTKAQETESGKRTATESGPREKQDAMSQKDGAPLTGKLDGPVLGQSSKKKEEPAGLIESNKNYPNIKEEEKDQIHKPQNQKKPTNETGDKDAQLSSSRKRKAEDEEDTSGSTMKDKVGGIIMRFKKPRQLMVNIGVAAVILVGLAAYLSYKLRKSIKDDES